MSKTTKIEERRNEKGRLALPEEMTTQVRDFVYGNGNKKGLTQKIKEQVDEFLNPMIKEILESKLTDSVKMEMANGLRRFTLYLLRSSRDINM
jgi:hypothetical protein